MTLRSRLPTTHAGGLAVALVVSVVATTLIFAAVAAASAPMVVVTDEHGEEIVAEPVTEETEIVLEYTHSVERTLVRDVYVVENGGIVTHRMEFSSFGAGLPSEAAVTERNGRYVYHPPSTVHEVLRVKTGHIADHDLVVGDERFDLAGMTDGGAVEITVEQRRRISL